MVSRETNDECQGVRLNMSCRGETGASSTQGFEWHYVQKSETMVQNGEKNRGLAYSIANRENYEGCYGNN